MTFLLVDRGKKFVLVASVLLLVLQIVTACGGLPIEMCDVDPVTAEFCGCADSEDSGACSSCAVCVPGVSLALLLPASEIQGKLRLVSLTPVNSNYVALGAVVRIHSNSSVRCDPSPGFERADYGNYRC